MKVYTVYDIKAQAYNQPFFLKTKGLAVRGFTDVVNDPKTDIFKYPEDYVLYEIGEWNELEGQILPHEKIDCVGKAIEFKKEIELGRVADLNG